jgi:aldose 1-epimerase
MENLNLKSIFAGSLFALTVIASCTQSKTASDGLTQSGLNPADFDTTYVDENKGEKQVALYTLKNAAGMEVCITNFGGRIVSIMVPDKDGNMQDVVLGFDTADKYFPQNNASDFGAAIGRYANRIANGKIVVEGDTVQLPQNNFGHCLHGGPTGYQYQVYDASKVSDQQLELTITSPDGDNNFPGQLTAKVTYTLTDDNAIEINYEATTDKETVVNMTNHSYFNLSGDPNNTVADELIMINADAYTPTDATYMTTGEIRPVEGTSFDFRELKKLGTMFGDADKEIAAAGGGYDHNWVLNTKGNAEEVAVKLVDPRSGIALEVYTNEPGIQVYTGNFLDGTAVGKKGITYGKQAAICLESQKFPDSPNKYTLEGWENSNPWLKPGETYKSFCKFKFSVEK